MIIKHNFLNHIGIIKKYHVYLRKNQSGQSEDNLFNDDINSYVAYIL